MRSGVGGGVEGVRGDDSNDKQEGRKAGGERAVNGEGEAFHLILQLVSLQVCQSIPCPVLQHVASNKGDHPCVLVLLPPSSDVNTNLVFPERGERERGKREGRGKGEEGRGRGEERGGRGSRRLRGENEDKI